MAKDSQTDPIFAVFNEIGIIEQLSRALMEARLPKGLILPHFAVVNHLTRLGDGRTPLSIASAFQVPKTTMTHTLAGLEKHGLIEMRPNPEDGRSKTVHLTDAGRTFRQDAIDAFSPDIALMLETIPASEFAKLLPILTRIREYLDENRL